MHRRIIVLLLLATPAFAQANVSADSFPGADIGAKINAAFASGGGSRSAPVQAVVVNLNPGLTYRYSTAIVLPNSTSSPYVVSPVLDCHGALLTWIGGASDQMTVLGENNYKSGEIRNCKINGASGSTITFYSRIDFRVSHSYFHVPIRFVNDLAHGGPGYTEQVHWDDIQLEVGANSCGITFSQAPGLTAGGSYFYNWFSHIHLDLNDGARGFCLAAFPGLQPVIFGGNFDLHVNTGGKGNAVFYLGPGTAVTRGVVTITGENTGNQAPQYDVYANKDSSFYNAGTSYAPGFVHGYAAGVPALSINWIGGVQPVSNDLSGNSVAYGATRTLAAEPNSLAGFRQCSNQQVGSMTAFLLASSGGTEQNCSFEIASRATDTTYQDVDIAGASGHPITTKMWASSVGGVGFGPGFSAASYARSTVEVRGGLTVRNPSLGVAQDGATATRQIDASGNAVDLFSGGARGQSFHYRQMFADTFAGSHPVAGLDCYAKGSVFCSVPNLGTGTSANTDLAGQITLSSGIATYSFAGSYSLPPICTASDTSSVSATQVIVTKDKLTVRGTSSDVVNYVCVSRQ